MAAALFNHCRHDQVPRHICRNAACRACASGSRQSDAVNRHRPPTAKAYRRSRAESVAAGHDGMRRSLSLYPRFANCGLCTQRSERAVARRGALYSRRYPRTRSATDSHRVLTAWRLRAIGQIRSLSERNIPEPGINNLQTGHYL